MPIVVSSSAVTIVFCHLACFGLPTRSTLWDSDSGDSLDIEWWTVHKPRRLGYSFLSRVCSGVGTSAVKSPHDARDEREVGSYNNSMIAQPNRIQYGDR